MEGVDYMYTCLKDGSYPNGATYALGQQYLIVAFRYGRHH